MQLRLAEIAAKLGMTLRGEDCLVSGVNTLTAAGPDELSFLANPRYAGELKNTRAAAVIVSPGHAHEVRRALVSDNPYQDFGRTLSLFAREQGFFSGVSPLAFVHEEAVLGDEVTIGPYACIGPRVRLGDGVRIFPGCYVGEDCVIGAGTVLYPGVTVMAGTEVGRHCVLHPGVVLGSDGFGFTRTDRGVEKIPQVGRVVIADDVEIGSNTTIDRAALDKTSVGAHTKIDNLVQIGHNVTIGEANFIVSQVGISGSCTLGDNVTLAGQAGLSGHLRIGDNATVGPQSGLARDVPADTTVGGSPAVDYGTFMRTMALMPRFPEVFKRLKHLENELAELRAQRGGKEPA